MWSDNGWACPYIEEWMEAKLMSTTKKREVFGQNSLVLTTKLLQTSVAMELWKFRGGAGTKNVGLRGGYFLKNSLVLTHFFPANGQFCYFSFIFFHFLNFSLFFFSEFQGDTPKWQSTPIPLLLSVADSMHGYEPGVMTWYISAPQSKNVVSTNIKHIIDTSI